MRVLPLLLMAVLALAPLTVSGSAEDPEITDPAGDVGTVGGAPSCAAGACNAAPKFIDLTKAYVDVQTETEIVFVINIAGNYNPSVYGAHHFAVHFKVGADAFTAGLDVGRSSTSAGDDSETPSGVASDAGYDGSQIRITVPLTAIGAVDGTVITEFYASSKLDLADQHKGTFADRAPDSGFGRDYVVAIAAPEPSVLYANITAFPFLVETTNATTGVFQYNWTGDAAFRFVGEVLAGNMTINVTANNETVFAWNGTDGLDEMMESAHVCADESVTPVPCDYAFTYTLTDFVGMYGIDLATEQTMGETNATEGAPGAPGTDGGNGTSGGNQTDEDVDGAVDGKESPGFALPLLVIALIVIARRR